MVAAGPELVVAGQEAVAVKKGAYRLEDLKEAYSRFTKDPDDIEAKFYLGQALQFAGQAEEASDQFAIFHRRLCEKYGSHEGVLQYYNDHIAALSLQSGVQRDQKRVDTVRAMIRVLEQTYARDQQRRQKSFTCSLS